MKTSICIQCGAPIEQSGRGQPRKFCSDSHKVMFSKAPHDTYTKPSSTQSEAPLSPEILAKFAKSKPSKHQPPPKQPPTNEQLLTNCWKHMPASQAAYMPVQPHQTLEECLQIEHQRRGAIYIPAPKPPQDPAFLPGNPIPFQLPPNTPVT